MYSQYYLVVFQIRRTSLSSPQPLTPATENIQLKVTQSSQQEQQGKLDSKEDKFERFLVKSSAGKQQCWCLVLVALLGMPHKWEGTSFIHCPMGGDELLPKRSPDKNQRLFMINGTYHVKYSVRNSLDKLKRFQQFIFTGWWWEMSFSRNVALVKFKGFSW